MFNLYTETAFQPTDEHLVNFDIPRHNGSYHRSSKGSAARTEPGYAARYLATSSDIYFRTNHLAPRCIRWRVVEDDGVLELSPADLTRSETDTQEAHLTLQFRYQDTIQPGCVVLADTPHDENIHIFVCTSRGELSHLRIPPAAFRQVGALSSDIGKWASAVEISSLAIDKVYRLHAHSPYELFIAYTSGIVQRVRRKTDGTRWEPENYDDATWTGSLGRYIGRGALRSIDYGSAQIDTRAVQAMTVSPDGTYLYTLCLNHQIRVWNLANGRLAATKDLLDISHNSQDRTILKPGDRGHIQLTRASQMKHSILVTFSPHGGGQFKMWDVKGSTTGPLVLVDKYPRVKLSPPDPDPSGNAVWSLIGFHISPGSQTDPAELWVLWRNNNHHRLYSLKFEFGDIEKSWNENWVTCSAQSTRKLTSPMLTKASGEDVTSPWLAFIFTPGRYSRPLIETAISIYSAALSLQSSHSSTNDSLRSRICSIVAAGVSLRKYGQSDLDYDRFVADTDYQWNSFWRILENLNDSRHAPVAFAYDPLIRQPWVLMADKCAAVRECNDFELLQQPQSGALDDLQAACASHWRHRKVDCEIEGILYSSLAILVSAVENFRKRFPVDLARELEVALDEEIFTNAERMTPTRLYEIYDSVNFSNLVSDEAFHALENDLNPIGQLGGLDDEIFLAAVELLARPQQSARESNLRNTLFAKRLFTVGIYEALTKKRQVLWDLMATVIFIEGEFNQEEDKMESFDAAEIVEAITPHLRLVERELWLSTHQRQVPLSFHDSASGNPEGQTEHQTHLISILEDSGWKAIEPKPAVDYPQSYLLTQTLHEIQDHISGVGKVDYNDGAVFHLADLISHGELGAATTFLAFCPSTPWAAYVQGRLYLAKADFSQSGQFFRQACYGLAYGKAVGDLTDMSRGLVTDAESFFSGAAAYLEHVQTLFFDAKAYVEAAQFGRLSLQALDHEARRTCDKSRLLSRVLTAEIHNGRFMQAFEALSQMTDQNMQQDSTTILIDAVLGSQVQSMAERIDNLLMLPWSLFPPLALQLEYHLSKLAKRQRTVSGDDYLQLMYAIRVAQSDYRGAVSVLYSRLQLLQRSGYVRRDPSATVLRQTLLILINLMAMVRPEDAYILVDDESRANGVSGHNVNGEDEPPIKKRRIIVTLDDLRKTYQDVLDRCSRVERGDFDFGSGGSEVSDDVEYDGSKLDFTVATRSNANSMVF